MRVNCLAAVQPCCLAANPAASQVRMRDSTAKPDADSLVSSHFAVQPANEKGRTDNPDVLVGMQEQRSRELNRPITGFHHGYQCQPCHRRRIGSDNSAGVIPLTQLHLHARRLPAALLRHAKTEAIPHSSTRVNGQDEVALARSS